jgi:hypothetical protein
MTKKPHHPLPDDDRAEKDRVPERRENGEGANERTEQPEPKNRTYRYPDDEPYNA